MAAIAKFISYDGGIAFSDSVLKIQKRDDERGRLIPIGDIAAIEVDEPLLGDDGCVRVQIAGKKPSVRNTVYFNEEQYRDALSFKAAFDSFIGQTSPALPPLEMFQPTSIARRPQRQSAWYAEPERTRRPVKQRRRRRRFRWWYALVALLIIGIIAMPGKEDTESTKAVASDNPLLNLAVVTAPVMNGPGTQQIGERAYIKADAQTLTDKTTPEQFHEFVDSVVDGNTYNGFTIDLGDGTGMQFTGTALINYGYIDEEGRVTESIDLYGIGEDGHYHVLEDETPEVTQAEETEPEATAFVGYTSPPAATSPPITTPTSPPVATQQPQTGTTYVLNTNTMKFHIPSCHDVGKISTENRQDYTGTRDEVIAKGYSPCGHCHP